MVTVVIPVSKKTKVQTSDREVHRLVGKRPHSHDRANERKRDQLQRHGGKPRIFAEQALSAEDDDAECVKEDELAAVGTDRATRPSARSRVGAAWQSAYSRESSGYGEKRDVLMYLCVPELDRECAVSPHSPHATAMSEPPPRRQDRGFLGCD